VTCLRERAILSPTNDTANSINSYLLGKLPSSDVKDGSVYILEVNDAVHYHVKLHHSFDSHGLAPHTMNLKICLNPPKLCNRTKLQIKALHKQIIKPNIFTGVNQLAMVYIP